MPAPVNPKTRRKVFERDRWHCHYCDTKLYEKEGPTVDHKVPRSRGGKNTLGNLVACAHWCNCAKGDMPYDLFVAILDEVGFTGSSRKTLEQASALCHERTRPPSRPQWNAVPMGACG